MKMSNIENEVNNVWLRVKDTTGQIVQIPVEDGINVHQLTPTTAIITVKDDSELMIINMEYALPSSQRYIRGSGKIFPNSASCQEIFSELSLFRTLGPERRRYCSPYIKLYH